MGADFSSARPPQGGFYDRSANAIRLEDKLRKLQDERRREEYEKSRIDPSWLASSPSSGSASSTSSSFVGPLPYSSSPGSKISPSWSGSSFRPSQPGDVLSSSNSSSFVGPIQYTQTEPKTSKPIQKYEGIRNLTKDEHTQAAAGAKSFEEYLENQRKIRAGTFELKQPNSARIDPSLLASSPSPGPSISPGQPGFVGPIF